MCLAFMSCNFMSVVLSPPPFRHCISIVQRTINLTLKSGRSQRDKLDRRRSTKLSIPQSSDSRPLYFITEIDTLYLQHKCRPGQLVTAYTCCI